MREWQSSGSDGGASTELATGVKLAGIVWELLVLAMPQNQPRRKRWTGEHAWTSWLLRASLATEKKGSVFEDPAHETPGDQYVDQVLHLYKPRPPQEATYHYLATFFSIYT